MKNLKEVNELSELLKNENGMESGVIYQKTVDFLLEEGFTQKNIDNGTNAFYVLEDQNGESHIGNFYEFLISQNIADYTFTRRLGNGKEKTYQGIKAVEVLVKTMKIKNAIYEAKSKGSYELAEHLTSSIDLDYSDD